MTRRKLSLTWAYVAAFAGVLITQLPHVWWAYSRLERTADLAWTTYTALGAAVVFETSLAVFSLRLVLVRGRAKSRRWTQAGVGFFILASMLANADYYNLGAWASVVLPWFLTVAIPLAVALFTHEFGRNWQEDVARNERAQQDAQPQRAERATARTVAQRVAIPDSALAAIAAGERTRADVAAEFGVARSTVTRRFAKWRGDGNGNQSLRAT